MKKPLVILIRNAAQHDFGGGERVPVFIAREVLKSDELRVLIFSHSKKLLDFAKANNVPYKDTPWWSRQTWSGYRVLFTPLYVMWQLILFYYYLVLFACYRPSVVHIQSKDDFIAGTIAARLLGVRVIWSDYADLKHIFRNHRVWYKNPIGKMVYACAHLAERIFVVSKEDKRLISINIPNGPVKNKFEIVYYGAFDSFEPIEKYKTFTFISTGRLVTDKGIGELISSFKRFHEKIPDSRLYLLGDGPQRELFENQAADNSAIHFLGYKQKPLKYVARSHVYLLPTYHEGFSLALVEACMLSLPIIATDVGGNPEIIQNNVNGLLVPVKDIDKLYDAMLKLYNDEELRDKLAKNARKEYVGKFDFEKIIKEYFLKTYREKI